MLLNPYRFGAAAAPTLGDYNPAAWHSMRFSTTGYALNSGRVSALFDLSGNGVDIAQGTAGTQPLLVASQLNGFPACRFDDIRGDTLLNSVASGVHPATALTWVILAKGLTDHSTAWPIGWGNANPFGDAGVNFGTHSDTSELTWRVNTSGGSNQGNPDRTPFLNNQPSLLFLVFNNGAVNTWKDDSLYATESYTHGSGLAGADPFYFGGDLRFDLFEEAFFAGDQTANRAAIQDILAADWGL